MWKYTELICLLSSCISEPNVLNLKLTQKKETISIGICAKISKVLHLWREKECIEDLTTKLHLSIGFLIADKCDAQSENYESVEWHLRINVFLVGWGLLLSHWENTSKMCHKTCDQTLENACCGCVDCVVREF